MEKENINSCSKQDNETGMTGMKQNFFCHFATIDPDQASLPLPTPIIAADSCSLSDGWCGW
jgi:hypothetical protein